MNLIYRKVWSRALGQMVVASEFASSQGRSTSIDKRTRSDLRLLVLAITFALGVAADNSHAQAQSFAGGGSDQCDTLYSANVGGCAGEGISVSLGARAYTANDYALALAQMPLNGALVGANPVNPAQSFAPAASAASTGQYFSANGVGDGNDDAVASGSGSLAAGVGSHAVGVESTAVGSYNEAGGDYTTAIGYENAALGTSSSAVGSFNQVNGENANAFGTTNFVDGANATAVGSNAVALGAGSLALGNMAQASLERALAAGDGAKADALDSIALGSNALAEASNAVSLGVNAQAANIDSVALGAGSVTDRDLSVSVGDAGRERQVTHVAAGTEGTDAVNLNQLNEVASVAEETSKYFVAEGTNESSAGAYAEGYGAIAIGEAASAISESTIAIGEGATAVAKSALALGHSALAQGQDSMAMMGGATAEGDASIAVGTNSWAAGSWSIALGESATALDDAAFAAGGFAEAGFQSVSVGFNATAGDTSVAIGGSYIIDELAFSAEAAGYASVAVGAGAFSADYAGVALGAMSEASEQKSVAIGFRARAQAHDSIALGAASLATRAFTVSVGDVGFERQIVNVAPGTEATDAVNKGQLDAVSAVAEGTNKFFKATASVDSDAGAGAAGEGALAAGESANAFGDAAVALGNKANALANGAVALGGNSLALGTDSVALGSGSVAMESDVISVGSGDGLNGPATRRIVNVSDGQVAAGSTDAVNGGQLNDTNQRVGVVETRVDAIDSRIVEVEGVAANAISYDDDTRSTATLKGANGSVIDNLAAGNVAANSMQVINGGQLYDALGSVASLMGGGAALGLQGAFITPTYLVQGASYHTVGDALAALDTKVTALGSRVPDVNGDKGVVLGDDASADQTSGTGIGHGASANGVNDTAVGNRATVLADNGTALGASATVASTAKNGVAVGAGAIASATNSTALGQGASASGSNSTALGQGASAVANNSVALGQGTVADRDNSVSVGSKGHERQITNVAAGTGDTDAVNKAQLDQGVMSANRYADGKFAGLNDSFDLLRSDVNKELRHMDRRIDRQGAMSAAMLNMAVSAAGVRTDNRVGVGVGFQGGESALSLGYQRALSERATLTVGGAFSSDDSSVGIGAGFGW
ncbi:ESPR-type extended signal peptide-containing protein [Stenotrophomonas sp. UBA7606]|uniref:ESPR-type extended signal peptide-containing protein n=1 Tax=Stenotrophomonas sp. UBA7606 TaxID=1947559 RepID=UPI0025DD49D5|nr:ESPR-type extended signal peptide-containing protein [Stenotrophomonas sp. UBA7606]